MRTEIYKKALVNARELMKEKTEENKENKEVIDVENKLDNQMDSTPKTSDETDIKTWLLIMAISLGLTAI